MSDVNNSPLGWRVVIIKQEGVWFRAYATYRHPSDNSMKGPRYCLSDRGRTPEEAKRVLLIGCMLDKKYPHLLNEVSA